MTLPHHLALVLTPKERIELERWVHGRDGHPSRAPHALLLAIAKRVLAFQPHVNEAVIAHDHRNDRAFELPSVSRDATNQLCKAWWAAGGRFEAIANGVGNLDVEWHREVWTRVAASAKAIFGIEPIDEGIPCPACHEFGDCLAQCPHAGMPRNESECVP